MEEEEEEEEEEEKEMDEVGKRNIGKGWRPEGGGGGGS